MAYTFRDLLWQSAIRYRDRPAVVDLANGAQATYGELDARANRLANGLLSLGLTRGDVVALSLPNGLRYLESEFAVAKAGLVRVGLMPSLDRESVALRLSLVAPKAIVLEHSHLDFVRSICRQIAISPALIVVGGGAQAEDYEALLGRHPASEPAVRVEEHDPCSLRFTSGSTGTPKVALHDQKACLHFALQQLLEPNWGRYYGEDERYLQHAHLSTGTIMWLHATYASGGVAVILPEYSAPAALKTIAEQRITVMFATPAVVSEIVGHPDFSTYDLSSLRTVMVGGAPFSPAKRAQARAALGEVFVDYYSATEYPLTLTMQRGEHRDGALGRAFLGVQVRVVDEESNELPPGEVGRLVVRGNNVLREYWNNPEATRRVLHDGWVDVGDLARMDGDGMVYFVERQAQVIQIGGRAVYPTEIEAVLSAHPAVHEVAVFATGGGGTAATLHAVLTLKADQSASVEDLTAVCRENLPAEAVPGLIRISSEPLPKSPLGKIMRRTLQEKFAQEEGSAR